MMSVVHQKLLVKGKAIATFLKAVGFWRGMQNFPSLVIIRLSTMPQSSSFHNFDWKTFEVNPVLAPPSPQNS